MSKMPPIPPEQRSFEGEKPDRHDQDPGRRDKKTGLQSSETGDADVNLEQQGRQGNIAQNIRPQWKVQDR
jgi:hypothetical protein